VSLTPEDHGGQNGLTAQLRQVSNYSTRSEEFFNAALATAHLGPDLVRDQVGSVAAPSGGLLKRGHSLRSGSQPATQPRAARPAVTAITSTSSNQLAAPVQTHSSAATREPTFGLARASSGG
jgi:hypothetical protein